MRDGCRAGGACEEHVADCGIISCSSQLRVGVVSCNHPGCHANFHDVGYSGKGVLMGPVHFVAHQWASHGQRHFAALKLCHQTLYTEAGDKGPLFDVGDNPPIFPGDLVLLPSSFDRVLPLLESELQRLFCCQRKPEHRGRWHRFKVQLVLLQLSVHTSARCARCVNQTVDDHLVVCAPV